MACAAGAAIRFEEAKDQYRAAETALAKARMMMEHYDEVAREGVGQEEVEDFIKLQVEKGRPVIGLYPPNDKIRAEFEEWVAAGKPR